MALVITIDRMGQLVSQYASHLREVRGLSPRTISRYKFELEDFECHLANKHGGASFGLEEVTRDDLELFLRRKGRRKASRSHGTWNTRLSALRSFYNYLLRKEFITMNPALLVERQRTTIAETTPLSLNEILAFVDAATSTAAAT